jgi:hypothetical protein
LRLSLYSLQIARLLALHPFPLVSTQSYNPESPFAPVCASSWRQGNKYKELSDMPVQNYTSAINGLKL